MPPLAVTAAAVVGALCCVPTGPCGETTCHRLASEEACVGLAQALAATERRCHRPAGAQRDGASLSLADLAAPAAPDLAFGTIPTWQEVMWDFVHLPLLTMAVLAPLWLVLSFVYSHLHEVSEFRMFIHEYVGSLDHPIPQVVWPVAAANVVQIAASFCSVGIFIVHTYMRFVHPWIGILQWYLGLIFASIYLLNALRCEFRISHMLSGGKLIDIVTVPPLLAPQMSPQLNWLSLGFLRCVPALVAHSRLDKLGVIRLGRSDVMHELIRFLLQMITLVVCFASAVLVLEVLGEVPLGPQDAYFSTAMGDISFFTLLYWSVETVTTVGYGDLAPKTFLSRLVTASCMVGGVTLFTLEMNRIFHLVAQDRRGGGNYQPSKKRAHVVLMGGGVQHADTSMLEPFIAELFHPSARNEWPHLVVMTSLPSSADRLKTFIQAHVPFHAQHMVTVLVGSPFSHTDLRRCGCEQSALVFFISDTGGNLDPLEEDKENILRALSLQNAFPCTPFRLMLLKPESKQTALALGIWPERCFSIVEVCCGMLWLSCRGVGWSTMFTNLMVSNRHEKLSRADIGKQPWLERYFQGMNHQIYGFLPHPHFYGSTIRELTAGAYQKYSICVIAVQIEGTIVLAPLRNTQDVIHEETVAFAIVHDEDNLLHISDHQRDWKCVFFRQRGAKHYRTDMQAGQAGMKIGKMRQRGFLPVHAVMDRSGSRSDGGSRWAFNFRAGRGRGPFSTSEEDLSPERRATLNIGRGTATVLPGSLRQPLLAEEDRLSSCSASPLPSPPRSPRQVSPTDSSGDGTATPTPFRGAAVNEDVILSTLSTPLRERSLTQDSSSCGGAAAFVVLPGLAPPKEAAPAALYMSRAASNRISDEEMLRILSDRVYNIRSDAASVPFLLLLNLSSSWEQVAGFIALDNRRFLPFRMPMVVLCPAPPPRRLVEKLKLFEDKRVGVCVGSPSWAEDLLVSGIKECSLVVCLGQLVDCGRGGSTSEMLDADVLMVQRMLQRFQESHKHVILEFNQIDNMRLLSKYWSQTLSPTEDCGERSAWHSAEMGRAWDGDSSFCLDPHFASGQVFFPRVLASLLAGAYRKPGMIELMMLFWGTHGTYEEGKGKYLVWQVMVHPDHRGRQYGDLFEVLLGGEEPALLLGLLRRFELRDYASQAQDPEAEHCYGHEGYVLTNPDKSLEVKETDLLFVLADSGFGKQAHDQCLLPFSAPSTVPQ